MIIVVNKPYGVLSQFNQNPDYPNQKTLIDLDLPPELMPVGRLDRDSEGLLLLTDEKGFEEALLNPKKAHKRSYVVQVDGTPDRAAIEMLRSGVEIRGVMTARCWVDDIEKPEGLAEREPAVDEASAKRSSWLRMELGEGKNRQVRRMTAKVGYPTLRLFRERIGSFRADDLAVGEWRVMSEEERARLFA